MSAGDDLWVASYELESAGALNAVSERRKFRGFLIRSGSGYGCVHPWPELGDATVEECLEDRGNRLVRRALRCAAADGAARERGVSLFDEVRVPVSHATLPVANREAVMGALEAGFEVVKVKAGGELDGLVELMREFGEVRWRLDFNGAGEVGELRKLKAVAERIDFVEDPVVYDVAGWRALGEELGVTLANDREAERDEGSRVVVVKPAVSEVDDFSEHGGRVVVTSYMDHPVGQAWAAYEAGRCGIGEVCGLQTHGLFAATAFTECLGPVGPEFGGASGTGLGFDGLLEGLDWRRW